MSNKEPTRAYVYQPEPAGHPTPFGVAGPGCLFSQARYATRDEAQAVVNAINVAARGESEGEG